MTYCLNATNVTQITSSMKKRIPENYQQKERKKVKEMRK